EWEIDSAGTSSYHEGDPPHMLSQKIARLHGIDISRQACRRFIKEDMLLFDKIYVMDREVYADVKRMSGKLWDPEKTSLIMDEVYPGENEEVFDPWFGGEDGYHLVFEMIDKACDAIIKKASLNPSFGRHRLPEGMDVKASNKRRD